MCRESLPVWQKAFEEAGSESFTVVGIAMDAEGIAPAKIYYDKYKCTFPTLVDPNYALGFGVIPHAIFVDEHGLVLDPKAKANWKEYLKPAKDLKAVTDEVRARWTTPGARLRPDEMAELAKAHEAAPGELALCGELASRYLEWGLKAEARAVLEKTITQVEGKEKEIARAGGESARLLGQVYFQLSRACEGDRDKQVEFATRSFYLSPTIGFGKQIARIIDPAKFDGTASGRLDNEFREGTLKRLRAEREEWLK